MDACGRADWRTGGRTDRREDRKTSGRADGRSGGRADVWADGRMGGRADGRSDGRVLDGRAGKADERAGERADGRTGGRTDKQADKRTGAGGGADGHNMPQTPHPHIILNMVTAFRQVAPQRSPRLLFSIIKGDGAGRINGVLV